MKKKYLNEKMIAAAILAAPIAFLVILWQNMFHTEKIVTPEWGEAE